jgi:hypothetical protein
VLERFQVVRSAPVGEERVARSLEKQPSSSLSLPNQEDGDRVHPYYVVIQVYIAGFCRLAMSIPDSRKVYPLVR